MEKIIKLIARIIRKNKRRELKNKITPSKKYFGSANINASKDYQKRIEKILEKYSKNPNRILDFIQRSKTPVYQVLAADKILKYIKEDVGFILPQKGIKALYLNLLFNRKLSFSSSEMFVLDKKINLYSLSYDFYRWYCFKKGIRGYGADIQNKFKNIFELTSTSKIDTLTFDEILELRAAIKQDIEAIDFVRNFSIKNSMSKKNHAKIKQGAMVRV